MVDYQYVDDAVDLRRMQNHLRGSRRLSVDIESDSYHHYGEKIALVQICDGRENFIVDPFGIDMKSIAAIMEDRSIEKVFHDVDYDGRMLLTYLGVRPFPIFDTMIAARILGKDKVGLADLLGEYFGIAVNKRFQKADWSHRPLSREMLEYAALDVAHLLPLRDRLAEEMAGMSRREWASEEFSRLVEGLERMPDREVSALKAKGARELTPRQLAILQKLLEWREKRAENMDVPSFKVVGTERLLKLAVRGPRNRREIERSGILSPRQAARFGSEILGAVQKGMKVPDSKHPRFPETVYQRRDYTAERILKSLKQVRDRKARELGLDPGFLMSNAVLKTVARARPDGIGEMSKSGLLKDWQLQVMGEDLTQVIKKNRKDGVRP